VRASNTCTHTMASIHAQSDDETARILNRGHPSEAPAALHWFASWSVGDWLATLAVGCFGLWADSLPPFMRDIGPQLNDPTIAYPHTKADAQQYPTWLLFRLSIWLPLLLVTLIGMTASSTRRTQLLAELWLGLAGSITFAFAFICTVKAAVGRLRPDFLARCAPVGGLCTGAADVILEGRRSFPSGHSALSFAGLGFVSLVIGGRLARRTPWAGSIWKGCAVALPWLLALHIALSRLQDYWHHWQDIAVGTLIGHVAALGSYRLRFPSPMSGVGLVPHVTVPLGGAAVLGSKFISSPPESV